MELFGALFSNAEFQLENSRFYEGDLLPTIIQTINILGVVGIVNDSLLLSVVDYMLICLFLKATV